MHMALADTAVAMVVGRLLMSSLPLHHAVCIQHLSSSNVQADCVSKIG